MKTVFMGSPDFAATALKAMIDDGMPPVLVVSQPDKKRGRGGQTLPTPVKALALQYGIPVITPQAVNTDEFYDHLAAYRPDIFAVVAFGRILTPRLLALPVLGSINLHASLLPRWRGAAPINRAVMAGDSVSGVTTMLMDSGLDTGDMIYAQSVDIASDMTAGALHDRLATVGAALLLKTLKAVADGDFPRLPQDDALASYAARLTREDELLDWQQDAITLHNRIRGLSPFPGAYTLFNGKRLKVYAAAPAVGDIDAAAGQVVGIDGAGFTVKTGYGLLRFLTVQPEGKKTLDAADFVRGYQIQKGLILGN